MSLTMRRDTGTTTLRVVALEATMMEEASTPANPTTVILVATETMVALFPTEVNTRLIRLVTVDIMHQVVMNTAASINGSIHRVATTPQVALWAMASTEADIMAPLIMAEAMMSAAARTTTADMVATKEVTVNTEETITVAIELLEETVYVVERY